MGNTQKKHVCADGQCFLDTSVRKLEDFLFYGEKLFHQKIINKVKKKYVIGAQEGTLFSYKGWNLRQDEEGITITQQDTRLSDGPGLNTI